MRAAIRKIANLFRDDAGATSAEYAVLIAMALMVAVSAAYSLGLGVKELPRRIVSGQSAPNNVVTAPSLPANPNSPTYQPPGRIELFVPAPAEPDSGVLPWALFALVLSVVSIAGFVICRKVLEVMEHIRIRRKVRESTTEEEVEEVFKRIEKGNCAERVVRLRAGDTALVGRNMPEIPLDWLRGTPDVTPAVPVDPVADAARSAAVADFMAAFASAPSPTTSAVPEESPNPVPST